MGFVVNLTLASFEGCEENESVLDLVLKVSPELKSALLELDGEELEVDALPESDEAESEFVSKLPELESEL